MNYREALVWLFGTQRFGIKLGLDNISRLLRELDLPANEERFIHVAGTNGKGSVCAMIDAILRAEGYRRGLFTSPHLVTFRERIQANGEMIGETEVARGLSLVRETVRDWEPHPTFFEIATALGLHHFRERACEIVVLETGMGGRLDATNAIVPVISVITPIGLDHQKWLGNTLAEVAAEKAGIIKPGVPVVCAAQEADAQAVIEKTAAERHAPLHIVRSEYRSTPVALPGVHQRHNAALAIAALEAGKIEVSKESVRAGLRDVTWPARFQRWNDLIIIDGAHNPGGARVAVETWREVFGDEKCALVFGLLREKDADAIYRELALIASFVVLSGFRGERVVPPEELATIVAAVTPEMPHLIANDCAEALRVAEENSERVLVAGSLHLAGEILAHLRGMPGALEECAQ